MMTGGTPVYGNLHIIELNFFNSIRNPMLVCSHQRLEGFWGRAWTFWTALDRWIELLAGNW